MALLASGVAANLNIDVFAPSNFMQKNLVQSLIKTATEERPALTGSVAYSQCDDDAGVFSLDTK